MQTNWLITSTAPGAGNDSGQTRAGDEELTAHLEQVIYL
jgi:hypothetical protein